MTANKKSDPIDRCEVTLSGSLSLRCAGAIRAQLLEALAAARSVELAFGEIEEVDLSLVQLLCAAHRSALRLDRTLLLPAQLPAAVVQVIADAGLEGHIGCSSEGRGHCLWLDQVA